MIYVSFLCFLVALAGATLAISSLAYRRLRAMRARRAGLGAAASPVLLGSGVILPSVFLMLLGIAGDGITYKSHKVTPFTLFTGLPQTSIAGTIVLSETWAQLNFDPGQTLDGKPLQGFVVLLVDPAAHNPSYSDRRRAAYNYFSRLNGAHCTLTGEWQPDSPVLSFKVESVKC